MKAHLILYVSDQRVSTEFYRFVLNVEPRLDVPGMTEFELSTGTVLGLMSYDSAARLLGDDIIKMPQAGDTACAELYLMVDDAEAFHRRALSSGAREISPFKERDWGHRAAYSLDPDGHVLAFAEEIIK